VPQAKGPLDVAAIVEPENGPQQADSKTREEEQDLESQEYLAHISGLIQDMAERKKYAGRIFCLLAIWLIGIFLLLLLQGFLSPHNWFNLDDKVIIAAIGGTTLNVIGIFIVVARYLFPQKPIPKVKQKKSRGED
jgi:hypothetical protein